MASPDELLAMLEEAAEEAENAQNRVFEHEFETQYEEMLDELMLELIDEASLGVCFEVHRACKTGTFMLDESDQECERLYGKYEGDQETENKPPARQKYEIVQEKGRDVFGQVPMKKQLECVCPNCQRNLAASRFAPHLEKCMGMGRTSSRVASRRIAKSGKKDSDNESEENDEDDWNYTQDRKVKRLRRDRSTHSPRRGKNSKSKTSLLERSSDIPSVGSNASDGSGSNLPVYEGMGKEERRTLLLQTCGVISEHTKKMCTRSHRCPQHSDDQRKAVRVHLLGQTGTGDDEVHVDIDTYEEGDSQALRDSLQWDRISNPSPADSTSTTNSTGTNSRKKKPSKSSKKKSNSKTQSSTGASTPSSLYDFV